MHVFFKERVMLIFMSAYTHDQISHTSSSSTFCWINNSTIASMAGSSWSSPTYYYQSLCLLFQHTNEPCWVLQFCNLYFRNNSYRLPFGNNSITSSRPLMSFIQKFLVYVQLLLFIILGSMLFLLTISQNILGCFLSNPNKILREFSLNMFKCF